ncbi:MAG: leucine-rich repeat domain-containing protein [Candidatus Thorarchaeota archaeon]
MDHVHIRYVTTTNDEKHEKFRTDETEINLDLREIVSIDLLPLIWCQNLKSLSLRNNRIPEIDLTPLSRCISLESIHLSNNLLVEIDLSPLTDCTKLEEVELQGNQFQCIDLSPLFHCPELKDLTYDDSTVLNANLLLRSIGSWPQVILNQFFKIQFIQMPSED